MCRCHYLTVMLLCLFAQFSLQAQQRSPVLRLKSGEQQMPRFTEAALDSFNRFSPRFENKAQGVIQFYQLPGMQERKLLSGYGIELMEYLPDAAYTFLASAPLTASLMNAVGAHAVIRVKPWQKMDEFLAKAQMPSWAVKSPGTIDVLVRVPKNFNTATARQALVAAGFYQLESPLSSYGVLKLRLSPMRLVELADLPFISYVQAAPPADQTLNGNSRNASRASVLQLPAAEGGRGLRGDSVVVGVGDDADVQFHIDLSGRLINRSIATNSFHGNHTTGTTAGAGNMNEAYKGYAPGATVISQFFSGILTNSEKYASTYGMVLTNNSYGNVVECSYHGTYDIYAQVLDEQAFDLPQLQHVFASGNSGGSRCPPYTTGFHTVLGGYQSAKNVLTVGATNDSGAVAGFSSRGPVKDGRIKPEIMAHGVSVISTNSGNSYSASNGTSMASPAVTGGLALLYQRYRQLNGGADPKAALVKAIACNSAADLGNTGPDFIYGLGWLNLLRAVETLEQGRYFSGSITNGAQRTHSISIPAGAQRLKVLLYWHDPAASLISSKTLVNDLDLKVSAGALQALPWILDTAAANLGQPAATGADHTNNLEQVFLDAPAAGTYTLQVNGQVTNGSQEYFLVYEVEMPVLRVTDPGTAPLVPNNVVKIHWESAGDATSSFALDYSLDNGGSWISMAAGLAPSRRVFSWTVPGTPAARALIRIKKESTGAVALSLPFTILAVPVPVAATVQCPTYFTMNWNPVAGATDYELFRLQGKYMVPVATTTSTSFTFQGLYADSIYWHAVRARINGIAGRRSLAISFIPNTGTCAGSVSDNDLRLAAILSPVTGRKFTSTEIVSNILTVRVQNLDDAPAGAYQLQYSVNGAPFVTENVSTSIPAKGSVVYSFTTPYPFSSIGDHWVTVVVKNSNTDAATVNDTLRRLIRQLDNPAMDLSSLFNDGFEGALPLTYRTDTTGLFGAERYDFNRTTNFGRLRTFFENGISRSGNRAITLDQDRYQAAGNINYLTGTYNLSAYSVSSTDIRLDFFLMHHGQLPNNANRVWIRGSETQPWIEVYNLDSMMADAGVYKRSASIPLSAKLRSAGQEFSASFQVRWGQWGKLQATEREYGAGYTIDDLRMYIAVNDMEISLLEPAPVSCGLSASTAIRVLVRNNSATAAANVPVQYRINGGAWISAQVPLVPALAAVAYTFSVSADMAAPGNYLVEAVVSYAPDNFHENDTLRQTVVHLPVINSFPHLQDFESGKGGWYTGGKRSSWQYGKPASATINKAASGVRAWKTGLASVYQDNELSYLYGPCFDISGLSRPTLSFSAAIDIEDCGGVLCDGVWVEYSEDGLTWIKLAPATGVTNGYNKTVDQLWSIENYTRWHVVTFPLPAGLSRLRLRFVLSSDMGVTRQGMAIDDIHIYNNDKGIYEGPALSPPVVKEVNGSSWQHFESGGKLVASVNALNNSLGSTAVQVYTDTTAPRWHNGQYYHARNITVKPANRNPADSIAIRFYFTDTETEKLLTATGCGTCSRPVSAYDLGVSKYSDEDAGYENGSVSDDLQGIWQFLGIPSRAIVPFDKGYYAEFRVKDLSEFWLSSGGLDGGSPLPVKLMEFTAQRSGADVSLQWRVGSETNVSRYEVEVARTTADMQSASFSMIGTVLSRGNSTVTQVYSFTDTEPGKAGTRYYRLKIIDIDGGIRYSPVRPVVFIEPAAWTVYPNPSSGRFFVSFSAEAGAKVELRLLDATGRLLWRRMEAGAGMIQKSTIDLDGKVYPAGVYLLEIRIGSDRRVFPLNKQ